MNPNGAVLSIGSILRGSKDSYRVTGYLTDYLPSGVGVETYRAVYVDKPGDLIITMPKLVLNSRSYSIEEILDRIHKIGNDLTNEVAAWARGSRNEHPGNHAIDQIVHYIDFGSYEYVFEDRMLLIPFIVQEYIPGDSFN